MNLWLWLRGESKGTHALPSAGTILPAENGSVTPSNPGDLSVVRSAAIVPSLATLPTTPEAAAAWEGASAALLEERKAITQSTVKALKNATALEKLDTQLNQAWYEYRQALAESNLEKSRHLYTYIRQLHGQRAAYAQMGAGLQKAEHAATQRITTIAANLRGYLNNG